MNDELTIGLDHGFGRIKTANTDITTSVTRRSERPAIVSPNLLTYAREGEQAKYYELGGRRNILRRDKTENEEYWILTLGAIAKELNARKLAGTQRIRIAAGLPLESFSIKADKFRSYLHRPGIHKYEMGNRQYAITISGVHIYPQGYSALISIAQTLKKEACVHIIDIGSWTTDTLTLEHGIPVAHSERSEEDGVIRCFDHIRQAVQAEHGIELCDSQIEDTLLWDKTMKVEIVKTIHEEVTAWTIDMVDKLYQLGFKLSSCPVNFVGGGAYLLKRYLPKEKAEKFFSPFYWTDVHANAKGFEKACEAMRRKTA